MGNAVLATERLILCPPAQDDLPWVLAEMNTPAVMQHLGGVRSPEDVAENFAEDIAALRAGGQQRWTVRLKDSMVRVGRVGFFHLRSPAAPPVLQGQREIGWTFAQGHWGCGYASEAARAGIAFAFGPLQLPLLWSQTSDSNTASTRMMHRLGFLHRPELGYTDPDCSAEENPTTVWSMNAPR